MVFIGFWYTANSIRMVIQQALHRIWCGAKRVGLHRAFRPHLNAKYKQFLVVVGSVDVVGFEAKKVFSG